MKFSSEKIFWVLYAGIASYALYCYNPFVLFFQNDDFIHIPLSREGVLFQRNSFRPISDLSVIADHYLWGKNAIGYHITNLLLHIICSVLVFFFSKQVIQKYFKELDSKHAAYTVALLFFVYATHTEAVLWILGRSAIMGLIFSLLFLLVYLKRKVTLSSVAKYVLLLFLALLTYESSFILPLLAVFFLFADHSKNDRVHVTIVFVSFLVYLALRLLVIGEIFGTYEVSNIYNSGISTVAINYGKLVLRSFIPAYSQGIFIVILFSAITLTLLILLFKSPKVKLLLILTAVFVISLLPYCSLGIDAHGYEGERYLYFPLLFLCLLIVLIIKLSVNSRLFGSSFFAFILLMHSISLQVSASNFRIAGNVNKLIINSVNSLEGIDSLYVQQLPQAQNGALIMRDGFNEAITWLKKSSALPNVIISSKRDELLPLNKNYRLIYSDSLTNNHGTIKSALGKTAVFYFSDSALFVKK